MQLFKKRVSEQASLLSDQHQFDLQVQVLWLRDDQLVRGRKDNRHWKFCGSQTLQGRKYRPQIRDKTDEQKDAHDQVALWQNKRL